MPGTGPGEMGGSGIRESGGGGAPDAVAVPLPLAIGTSAMPLQAPYGAAMRGAS